MGDVVGDEEEDQVPYDSQVFLATRRCKDGGGEDRHDKRCAYDNVWQPHSDQAAHIEVTA